MDRPTMNRRQFGIAALALGAGLAPLTPAEADAAQSPKPAAGMPMFQVVPGWPTLPNNWIFGVVSSIRVDEQDHVWILQRPRSLPAQQKAHAAPPVLEFNADGHFL